MAAISERINAKVDAETYQIDAPDGVDTIRCPFPSTSGSAPATCQDHGGNSLELAAPSSPLTIPSQPVIKLIFPHYLLVNKPAGVRMDGDFPFTAEKLAEAYVHHIVHQEPYCHQIAWDSKGNASNGTLLLYKPRPDPNAPKEIPTPHIHNQKKPDFLRVRMVHQLDFSTSGVLVFGLTRDAASKLTKLFETRQVKKQYVAIVHGWMPPPADFQQRLDFAHDWDRLQDENIIDENHDEEAGCGLHYAFEKEKKKIFVEEYFEAVENNIPCYLMNSAIAQDPSTDTFRMIAVANNKGTKTISHQQKHPVKQKDLAEESNWANQHETAATPEAEGSASKKRKLELKPRSAETHCIPQAWGYVDRTKVTLVTLLPKTGRTHQLRVHLHEHGYPILGDGTYSFSHIEKWAAKCTSLTRSLNINRNMTRMMLHAYRIRIPFPPPLGLQTFSTEGIPFTNLMEGVTLQYPGGE